MSRAPLTAEQRRLLTQAQSKDMPDDEAARLAAWREHRSANGVGNEWTVAARLGEAAFTEEQAHMVASLFGRC